MRDALSSYLVKAAEADPRFYVFSGDHGYALFDALRASRPSQFINAGVCEQAMVGYAAGMVKTGLRAVVYGLAAFIPMRVVEFIKMDVCYDQLPILFLGDGAGLVYNTLGASHQCAEDVAALRSLPGMRIYAPADAPELVACLQDSQKAQSPCYLRIGKSDKPKIHAAAVQLEEGGVLAVRPGQARTVIIASGSMVHTATELAKAHDMRVYSAPLLTGMQPEKLHRQLGDCDKVITIEEHSICGGLGSIIAEALTARGYSGKSLLRLGLKNRFTQKCGSYDYAIREHGLDRESLSAEIETAGFA